MIVICISKNYIIFIKSIRAHLLYVWTWKPRKKSINGNKAQIENEVLQTPWMKSSGREYISALLFFTDRESQFWGNSFIVSSFERAAASVFVVNAFSQNAQMPRSPSSSAHSNVKKIKLDPSVDKRKRETRQFQGLTAKNAVGRDIVGGLRRLWHKSCRNLAKILLLRSGVIPWQSAPIGE